MKKSEIIVYISLWGLFFYFVYLTPYMADNFLFSKITDPSFSEIYSGKSIEKMEEMSFVSAFNQSLIMYKTWCGRFTGNLIVYLSFLLPHTLYACITATLFVIYIILLSICVNGRDWRKRNTPAYVLGIAAILWMGLPSFGSAFFWISVGGFAALLGQAIFFIPYRLVIENNKHDKIYDFHLVREVLFFFLSIFITSLDYATSVSLPSVSLAIVAWLFFKQEGEKRRIPWFYLSGCTGACIGGVLTLFAPGNYRRILLSNDDSVINFLQSSLSERVVDYISNIPLILIYHIVPIFLIVWCVIKIRKKNGILWKNKIPFNIISVYFIPFFITIASYFFTAFPPARAFTTTYVQLTLIALILLNMVPEKNVCKQFQFLKCILIIYCLITIPYESWKFFYVTEKITERENIYLKNSGKDVEITPLDVFGDRYMILGSYVNDISVSKDYWINRAIAKWYGVRSVRLSQNSSKLPCIICYRQEGSKIYAQIDTQSEKKYMNNEGYVLKVEADLAKFSEKKLLHFYYVGSPGLITLFNYGIVQNIPKILEEKKNYGFAKYLVPILYTRTDIKLDLINDRYSGEGILWGKLPVDSKIWIVKPWENATSFNVYPMDNCE